MFKYARNPISRQMLTNFLSGNFIIGRFTTLTNILAILVSWFFNHSILWAIFHWLFGFWYLMYCILSLRFADGVLVEIVKSYF